MSRVLEKNLIGFGFLILFGSLIFSFTGNSSLVKRYCSGCHVLSSGKDSGRRISLQGILDREVASNSTFNYSKAFLRMKKKKIRWTEENLSKFLTDTKAFVKEQLNDNKARTKMRRFKFTSKQLDEIIGDLKKLK